MDRWGGRRCWAAGRGVAVLCVAGICLAAPGASPAWASEQEIQQLRSSVDEMSRTIEAMKAKIEQLERESAAQQAEQKERAGAEVPPPPPAHPGPEEGFGGQRERVLASQGVGPQAPIDPEWRGFFPVPMTRAWLRFNAKPRVDFVFDTRNAGDDNRFITGKIPVAGDPTEGGGEVFNVNSKGSQLMLDVRAPDVAGAPRFYYQNDFFGSGGGEFNLRVQHLYGQIYGLTLGQTFSPFEDPDIWPDTVDYEGPNSMIFARFPLVRYKLAFGRHWSLNPGITQPDTQVASAPDDTVSGANHLPDFALNLRGESDLGHVQLASVFRDLGARSDLWGDQEAFGWGFNASGGLNVFSGDQLQGQLTYGQGLGRYGNDTGFFDTDAAFSGSGQLVALPYFGAFAAYTHRWAEDWRSTLSYGFVDVDNQVSQGPDAYLQTDYASVNLIWQLRERLSVGLEGLYGHNEKQSGDTGSVFRTQIGVVYSLF